MNKFAAAAVAFALALTACGVSRDSDETTTAPTEAVEEDLDAQTEVEEGEEGEDGDAATPTTLAPPTTTPPTTGAPDDVALTATFGDDAGVEFTHGELNEIVIPTVENEEFVNLVFGGQRPPGFDAGVLTEHLISEAVRLELEELDASVTEDDLTTSRETLLTQVAGLFSGAPDSADQAEALFDSVPYLPFLVEYQARQDKLSETLGGEADPTSGVPCVRHILLESEADADAVLADLEGGADFGELAVERSTGPSGPNGGDLGCADASGYVPEFATAVNEAEIGVVVGPVETQFGFHVLIVDRYEVDGRAAATEALRERLEGATVDVDPALGAWDGAQLAVTAAQ